MTQPNTSFMTNFMKGVRNGLVAPFVALNPPRVQTKIDRRLFETSYRSPAEDMLNIKSDFDKAVTIGSFMPKLWNNDVKEDKR